MRKEKTKFSNMKLKLKANKTLIEIKLFKAISVEWIRFEGKKLYAIFFHCIKIKLSLFS